MAISFKSVVSKAKSLVQKANSFLTGKGQTAATFQAPLLPGVKLQGGTAVQTQPITASTIFAKQTPTSGKIVPQVYPGSTSSVSGGRTDAGATIGSYSPSTPGDFNQLTGKYNPPSTIAAGKRVDSNFYTPPNTSSISSSLLGSGTSTTSAGGTGNLTLPGGVTSRDVGAVNLAGLTDAQTQRDENGLLIPALQEGEEEKEPEWMKQIREITEENEIPRKESLYEREEIRNQQAEVNRRQQETQNYQNQLNAVVAKQQADLLNLREIGSKEGVTETVYGGQQATINREAAIKALPIQAQLSAAQGNLELAQDYLKELKDIIKEDIDNEYNYQIAKYNATKEIANKEETRLINEMEKAKTRAYNEEQANLERLWEYADEARKNGQVSLMGQIIKLKDKIASPNFMQELGNIVGGIQASSSDTALSADKKRLLLGAGFTSSEATTIEREVNQYGLEKVLEGIDNEAQKRALREVYGSESSEEFLTRDFLLKSFTDDQLKKSAEEAGFRKALSSWSTEKENYLTHLDGIVEQYRKAGYSDQEILKMMQ